MEGIGPSLRERENIMAQAIQVTQTSELGYTVYKFEANNTIYAVLTEDNINFDVWSKRKNCSFDLQLKCYNSLASMAKRNKALKHLSTLIGA